MSILLFSKKRIIKENNRGSSKSSKISGKKQTDMIATKAQIKLFKIQMGSECLRISVFILQFNLLTIENNQAAFNKSNPEEISTKSANL